MVRKEWTRRKRPHYQASATVDVCWNSQLVLLPHRRRPAEGIKMWLAYCRCWRNRIKRRFLQIKLRKRFLHMLEESIKASLIADSVGKKTRLLQIVFVKITNLLRTSGSTSGDWYMLLCVCVCVCVVCVCVHVWSLGTCCVVCVCQMGEESAVVVRYHTWTTWRMCDKNTKKQETKRILFRWWQTGTSLNSRR